MLGDLYNVNMAVTNPDALITNGSMFKTFSSRVCNDFIHTIDETVKTKTTSLCSTSAETCEYLRPRFFLGCMQPESTKFFSLLQKV
jgi:hypothetical protein